MPEPQALTPATPLPYWEARAQRFAAEGAGLAAVCSYGMPGFYNRLIHLTQRLALARQLEVAPGSHVLDVGCGVGRWSRLLAARGAVVTGIDVSPTMIAEARRRSAARRLAGRCHFLVQDVAGLALTQRFDRILSVTVLQHILDPQALRAALARMAAHLTEEGVLILLEAAPVRVVRSCDSPVFEARPRSSYLRLFADCGLELESLSGVDPAPFRTWLLPRLPRLTRRVRLAALAGVTALSLPVDLLFGRRAVAASWHAVFVLRRARGQHAH
jgi:SAM-dependent methyltransferase